MGLTTQPLTCGDRPESIRLMLSGDFVTAAEIAKRFKVTRARVNAIAQARGIKPASLSGGHMHLYHAADVPRFKPGPAGRPKKKASKEPRRRG